MNNRMEVWKQNSWSPLKEFASLLRASDRMFEGSMAPFAQRESLNFEPACDIEETDSHYLISADLPGVAKEDVKVEVFENQIVVSGEKKQEKRDAKSNHVTERYHGRFERRFALPTPIDGDKVEASYQDGVLRIAMAKSAYGLSRQVKIADGKGSGTLARLFARRDEKKVDEPVQKAN